MPPVREGAGSQEGRKPRFSIAGDSGRGSKALGLARLPRCGSRITAEPGRLCLAVPRVGALTTRMSGVTVACVKSTRQWQGFLTPT